MLCYLNHFISDWQLARLPAPGFVINMAFTRCCCCLVFFNSSSFFITFVVLAGWLAGKKERKKIQTLSLYIREY
jgi:hypothetical protein